MNDIKIMTPRDKAQELTRYHKPSDENVEKITRVRCAVEDLITCLLEVLPPGADRSAAVRKARETMMTANAALVVPAVTI